MLVGSTYEEFKSNYFFFILKKKIITIIFYWDRIINGLKSLENYITLTNSKHVGIYEIYGHWDTKNQCWKIRL